MLCEDCTKRSICNTLCPEAEMYAAQDEINQSELTISELGINGHLDNVARWPSYINVGISLDDITYTKLTPKQKGIIVSFISHNSTTEICQMLKISKNALYIQTHRIRQKLK